MTRPRRRRRKPKPPSARKPDAWINQYKNIERDDIADLGDPPEATGMRGNRQIRKEYYLEMQARCFTRAEGCRRSNLLYHQPAEWARKDPEFKARWQEALEEGRKYAIQRAERTLYERAIDGWNEPVFHRGYPTGHYQRKLSNTLLIFWLKCNKPTIYGQEYGKPTDSPEESAQQIADFVRAAIDSTFPDGQGE